MLALTFDPTDTDVLYAGSASGGLWKSTDGGLAWLPLTDELPTLAVGGVAVILASPNVVLIGTGEATLNVDRVGGVGILKSTDGGTTWATTSVSYSVASGHGFHVLRANPANGTVLAGATDGLWRSTDEGDTWDLVRAGGNYYDVQWKPGDANRVYTCKGNDSVGNNVKVSTDDGVTWASAGTGQPSSGLIGKTKIAVTPDDPATIYTMYAESSGSAGLLGVYRSTDDGGTWELRATSPNIPGRPAGPGVLRCDRTAPRTSFPPPAGRRRYIVRSDRGRAGPGRIPLGRRPRIRKGRGTAALGRRDRGQEPS
jgi:photosystem II stability/assembly factor-like uncharacterized protein